MKITPLFTLFLAAAAPAPAISQSSFLGVGMDNPLGTVGDFLNDAGSCTHNGAQPASCGITCNIPSDKLFKELSGLKNATNPNNVPLGDVIGPAKLEETIQSFGDLEPMNLTQRKCVLDYNRWKGTNLYNASYVLQSAINQFAPYIWGDRCDQQLGSMGLFEYYNSSETGYETQSICNPDSPGKQFNTYMMDRDNGFTSLFKNCGYTFKDNNAHFPYFSDITQGSLGRYAIETAGKCQAKNASGGGNPDACYCVIDEAVGLHCPMFGPIFYLNQRIVYQVGGPDYVKSMPGMRVKCAKGDETSSCSGMCAPRDLCDFPACAEKHAKQCNLSMY